MYRHWTENNTSDNFEEAKKIAENHFYSINQKSMSSNRKSMPVFTGVVKYFPDALKEVSICSQAGNDQHHPDKPLHWDKNTSTDNEDAMMRHLIDHTLDPMDSDGVLHLTKVAWRALASLQIYLENERKKTE